MPTDSSRLTPPDPPTAPPPGLRADARHNRDRIREAARTLFTTRGIDVPMATVARHAGVGVATLYRHFPTRQALISDIVTAQVTRCLIGLDEGLADPDPWRGFRVFLEKVCAMNVLDGGFTAAVLTAFPDVATDLERQRVRAEERFAVLVRRAKAAGRLRADFARTDLSLLLMANNGITAESPEAALAASRRLVAHLIQSFRAAPAEPAASADPAGRVAPVERAPPAAPLGPYHLPWPAADVNVHGPTRLDVAARTSG